MSEEPDPPVCATCGRAAPDAGAVLRTWTRGTQRGTTVWACDACSRQHLRATEDKLDSAWW